jgi:hypothetical protein
LLSTGTLPLLRDGVLASIEDRLELPVVCKADVLASVGNGKLTALTGCVDCQKVPLTGTALALNCVSVRPCTKLLSTGTRPPLKAGVYALQPMRL